MNNSTLNESFKDGEDWRIAFREIDGKIWYPKAKFDYQISEYEELKAEHELLHKDWRRTIKINTKLRETLEYILKDSKHGLPDENDENYLCSGNFLSCFIDACEEALKEDGE